MNQVCEELPPFPKIPKEKAVLYCQSSPDSPPPQMLLVYLMSIYVTLRASPSCVRQTGLHSRKLLLAWQWPLRGWSVGWEGHHTFLSYIWLVLDTTELKSTPAIAHQMSPLLQQQETCCFPPGCTCAVISLQWVWATKGSSNQIRESSTCQICFSL